MLATQPPYRTAGIPTRTSPSLNNTVPCRVTMTQPCGAGRTAALLPWERTNTSVLLHLFRRDSYLGRGYRRRLPHTTKHTRNTTKLHCLVPNNDRDGAWRFMFFSSIENHIALLTRDNSLAAVVVNTRSADTRCNPRRIALFLKNGGGLRRTASSQ